MIVRRILLLSAIAFAGCSTGGESASSTSSAQPPGQQTGVQTATGKIIVNSVLARAVPTQITGMRFRGLGANGEVLYGPEFRAKTATIVLEGVPVGVRQLEIEYFQDAILRGRGVTAVTVLAGAEAQVTNPDFVDIRYALTSIRVDPASLVAERGQTKVVQVVGTYADNTTLEISDSAQWTSTNSSVAEVVGREVVARGVGNCSLTASVGNLNGSASVQVLPPRLVSLSLSPANATLLEGGNLGYVATGSFSDISQEALTNVTWSSSQPLIATITAQGNVTARQPGETLITASSGGLAANTTLTVAVNTTLLSLSVLPTDRDIPQGMNVQFRAFGTYVNGTTVDVTESAIFSSDTPNVLRSTGVSAPPTSLSLWPSYFEYETTLASQPPPFLPTNYASSVFGAQNLGAGNVVAEFEGLVGRASARVTPPVPLEAQARPLQVINLEVGGTTQLSTTTLMTDGKLENNRPDVTLQAEGPVTVSGNLVTAMQAGIARFTTKIPPLPTYPYAINQATYSFFSSPDLAPDYSASRQDPPGAVVSRDLSLRFSLRGPGESPRFNLPFVPSNAGWSSETPLLEDSPEGVFSANRNMLEGPRRNLTLPSTTDLKVIARGRFSGLDRVETFFAGSRTLAGAVDYGVLLSDSPAPGGSPEYADFSDAASGVRGAAVADFDGNGRDDVALVFGSKLLVRLSRAGVLDESRPLVELGPTLGETRAADLNRDGRLDLVISQNSGFLAMLGGGDGTFVRAGTVTSSLPGSQFRVGDIDGDGNLDVFFAYGKGQGRRHYALAYGAGDGTFPRLVEGDLGFRVQCARLADLTGDGKTDLAVVASRHINGVIAPPGNALICVYPGTPSGFLSPQVLGSFSRNGPGPFVLKDQNGDGRLDFVGQLIRWQNNSGFIISPALGGFLALRLP